MPDLSPEVIAIQKSILSINESIEELKSKVQKSNSDSMISEFKTRIEELIVSRDEFRQQLEALKKPAAPEPKTTPEDPRYELGHFE